MDPITLTLLCVASFVAGFIDAVAGGGGLVQLPALLVLMPTVPVPMLFGTNKFSSICGTTVAMWRYSRSVKIPWRTIIPASIVAFVFSVVGARTLTIIPSHYLRPLIIGLFVVVAIHTFRHRRMGIAPSTAIPAHLIRIALWASCAAIGFYDGFFGPGTGQFLILALIAISGMDFLNATASAKVVNFATNLAAVAYFASQHDILFAAAIPMAACNIVGGWLGARTAILKGSPFIRRIFLGMVVLLVAKLSWDLFSGW